jgi:hypothetical protein
MGLDVASTDVVDSLLGGLTDVGTADGVAVVDAIALGDAVNGAVTTCAIVVSDTDGDVALTLAALLHPITKSAPLRQAIT